MKGISISRNTGNLYSFDGWVAKNYGVDCAVVFNEVAHDDYDCRTYINAGMRDKLGNRVVIDGNIVWIRYSSNVLFEAYFPFYEKEIVKELLEKLEKARLVLIRPDNGSGFTWVALADGGDLSADGQEETHGKN